MAVTSAEELLAVLEKSKLLGASKLEQARRTVRPNDPPRMVAKSLARQGLITRWQAGQLLAGRSSFYLGKYRLIEVLGHSGTGNVLLGEHVTMSRRVALKVVPRPLCENPAALKRFLEEVPGIAEVDHPNIARVYSVDNEGDRYYLVMEYLEGIDLQRLVEQGGPLDCDLAADYIGQAAEGVEHAHRRNMIHCQISPSSLLLRPGGVIKLLDLGLTRLDAEPQAFELAAYCAPNAPRTLPGKTDGRTFILWVARSIFSSLAARRPRVRGRRPICMLSSRRCPPISRTSARR